jgi:AcrR family transcriptional regulator
MAALATGGPDAVRIEVLARELGVTKGGFYGHFADRQALLDEVLDTWERSSVDDVITRIEAVGGDGRTRLRRLFIIASTDVRDLHRTGLAVRQWARRDRDVARRLRRVSVGDAPMRRHAFGSLTVGGSGHGSARRGLAGTLDEAFVDVLENVRASGNDGPLFWCATGVYHHGEDNDVGRRHVATDPWAAARRGVLLRRADHVHYRARVGLLAAAAR